MKYVIIYYIWNMKKTRGRNVKIYQRIVKTLKVKNVASNLVTF